MAESGYFRDVFLFDEGKLIAVGKTRVFMFPMTMVIHGIKDKLPDIQVEICLCLMVCLG